MFVYKKHNIISLWIYIYWWYAAAGLRSFLINYMYLELFLLQFNFVCFIFESIHWFFFIFTPSVGDHHNSMLITVGHWRALITTVFQFMSQRKTSLWISWGPFPCSMTENMPTPILQGMRKISLSCRRYQFQ